jgi:hypothetical protein
MFSDLHTYGMSEAESVRTELSQSPWKWACQTRSCLQPALALELDHVGLIFHVTHQGISLQWVATGSPLPRMRSD